MQPHNINSTDSFIQGWYIDNNICDYLIDLYNKESTIKIPGLSMSPDTPMPDIKQSIDAVIPSDILMIQPYINELEKCMDFYTNKFKYSGGARYSIKEPINIQHYPVGGGFKVWHFERGSADTIIRDRHLVFMTYLNNVDDGGTQFLYQNLTIKAEKGLTLIWPVDWTHTHKGQISTTKEKTVITGWLSYN